MPGRLYSLTEAAEAISSGAPLLIAGDEALLTQLPEGRWIGGTIPYFMTADGGQVTREMVYVDTLPAQVTDVTVRTYAAADLEALTATRSTTASA